MTRILKNYISRKGVLYFAGIAVLILLSFLAGKGCRETSASKGSEHTEDVKESDETQIWTCSMHPRIRREEPGKCPICFMDLIPVSDAEGTSGDESPILTISENAKIMADIRTTEVKRQPAEVRITMNGKVAFDETSVGRITSRVSGRIDRLYVDYTGIPVK
ncbi:MAG: heavy metal-binding domain-containing protein, partial [Chitinivibrionales bacterium]